jgi:hypothetical protein
MTSTTAAGEPRDSLSITEMLAAVGIIRQTCAGGAPTIGGGIRSEYRCNISRSGQAFNFDAYEAALFARALAKTGGA